MDEIIELSDFKNNTSDSYSNTIEEYTEIKHDDIDSTGPEIKINDYDFFTKENNIKPNDKINDKNGRKKPSTLMDIIDFELAATQIVDERNLVSKIKYSKGELSSYLETVPKPFQKLSLRKVWRSDVERGWHNEETNRLNPQFPNTQIDIGGTESIDVQYIKPVKFEDIIKDIPTMTPSQKFVVIELRNLKFMQHHRYSLENLLAIKLSSMYKEYQLLLMSITTLIKQIKIARNTKTKFKEHLLQINPKKDTLKFDSTIRGYNEKLMDLKSKLSDYVNKRNEMENSLFSLWLDIEMVREKFGVTKTALVLEIAKKSVIDDEETFKKEWAMCFNIEANELLDFSEHEYVTRYFKYKERKHIDTHIKKPKLIVDETAIKEEAEKTANLLVRRENNIYKLSYNNKLLTGSAKKAKEKHIDFNFKLYIDDAVVCESEHYIVPLGIDFDIAETFSIQTLPKNSLLAFVFFENNMEVASTNIKISDIKNSFSNSKPFEIKIIYNCILEPTNKHIGSGYKIKDIAAANHVRLKSSNLFRGNIQTEFILNTRIGLDDNYNDKESDVKEQIETEKRLMRVRSGKDAPTINNLLSIIELIYGKEISSNEDIVAMLEQMSTTRIKNKNDFEIDVTNPEQMRLKLLKMRSNGDMTNVNNKQIPLFSSQMSTDQVNCLQNSFSSEMDMSYFSDKYSDKNPIELGRFIGAKYTENLNNKLMKNLNDTLLTRTHKDVVYDIKDFSFKNFFSKESNLSSFSVSNGFQRIPIQNYMNNEIEVQINVLRAFNLPDRTPSVLADENVAEDNEIIAGFKISSLRPFVRAEYQGSVAQTATAIGCHPSWEQQLTLKAKQSNLSSLYISIHDEHKTNISEAYEVENMFNSRTIQLRCFNRWLGGFEIPLYSLLSVGKIRGTFKINLPSLLLGYETQGKEKDTHDSFIPQVAQLLKKDTPFLFIQVKTNNYNYKMPQRYDLPKPSNSEDEQLIKYLNNFVTEYLNDFPTRNIALTFIDSSGRNKCITQFIQPIPLPDSDLFRKVPKTTESASKSSSSKRSSVEKVEYDKTSVYSGYEGRYWKGEMTVDRMMNIALRFVSLIPCYEVGQSHVVTLMGVDLLKTLNGSFLDHTILLSSYFTHLGVKNYIATGLTLMRGRSSYVLTKYDVKSKRMVVQGQSLGRTGFLSRSDGFVWYVYDPVAGERHELRDVGCPLKTVELVFDHENIWVNLQASLDCEQISLDFTKSSDWQSVFNKNMLVVQPTTPVVSAIGLYSDPHEVDSLRSHLEEKIKQKIQKWRPHVRTIWNRYCSSLLRETLPHWESWAFNPHEPQPNLSHKLKQLMVTYKVYGFAINQPYKNMKATISSVKSSRIYSTDEPNAEFALAVEVFAYPNNVLSVWIFLACISRI